MYVIFNELCEKSGLLQQSSKESIDQFIIFLSNMHRKNIVEGIVAINDIFSSVRDDECYSFQNWLNDDTVDREYKRFLRIYMSEHIEYVDTTNVDGEFRVNIDGNNHIGVGCALAHEKQDVLLSRITHDIWKAENIEGNYYALDEDGEISSKASCLTNINELMHCEKLKEIALEREFADISSGYDLWEKRERLYPNLIFCDDVKKHIYDNPEKYHIIKIMERLKKLQDYFSQPHGFYDPKELGLNARTESDTVKNDPDLKKYRLFKLPTGEQKYFFDHIGFYGKFSGGRIHFLPMVEEHKCYIGYIGKHLPTKNF